MLLQSLKENLLLNFSDLLFTTSERHCEGVDVKDQDHLIRRNLHQLHEACLSQIAFEIDSDPLGILEALGCFCDGLQGVNHDNSLPFTLGLLRALGNLLVLSLHVLYLLRRHQSGVWYEVDGISRAPVPDDFHRCQNLS